MQKNLVATTWDIVIMKVSRQATGEDGFDQALYCYQTVSFYIFQILPACLCCIGARGSASLMNGTMYNKGRYGNELISLFF